MRACVYRFARGTKIPGKSPVSWFPSFTTFRSWRVATWMIASPGVSPTVAWGMVGAGLGPRRVRYARPPSGENAIRSGVFPTNGIVPSWCGTQDHCLADRDTQISVCRNVCRSVRADGIKWGRRVPMPEHKTTGPHGPRRLFSPLLYLSYLAGPIAGQQLRHFPRALSRGAPARSGPVSGLTPYSSDGRVRELPRSMPPDFA
jgi:hypothetical protein